MSVFGLRRLPVKYYFWNMFRDGHLRAIFHFFISLFQWLIFYLTLWSFFLSTNSGYESNLWKSNLELDPVFLLICIENTSCDTLLATFKTVQPTTSMYDHQWLPTGSVHHCQAPTADGFLRCRCWEPREEKQEEGQRETESESKVSEVMWWKPNLANPLASRSQHPEIFDLVWKKKKKLQKK